MDTLSPPTKSISEVLAALISRSEIREAEFSMNSFRTILSELRNDYGLPIQFHVKEGLTKHKKKIKYKVHYLFTKDIPAAEALYKRINSDK